MVVNGTESFMRSNCHSEVERFSQSKINIEGKPQTLVKVLDSYRVSRPNLIEERGN
jgi:hypothetical protein